MVFTVEAHNLNAESFDSAVCSDKLHVITVEAVNEEFHLGDGMMLYLSCLLYTSDFKRGNESSTPKLNPPPTCCCPPNNERTKS